MELAFPVVDDPAALSLVVDVDEPEAVDVALLFSDVAVFEASGVSVVPAELSAASADDLS